MPPSTWATDVTARTDALVYGGTEAERYCAAEPFAALAVAATRGAAESVPLDVGAALPGMSYRQLLTLEELASRDAFLRARLDEARPALEVLCCTPYATTNHTAWLLKQWLKVAAQVFNEGALVESAMSSTTKTAPPSATETPAAFGNGRFLLGRTARREGADEDPGSCCRDVALAGYPEGMVNPALQSAIEAMSLDERLELVEYIESTVESASIDVTEEQKGTIRSRAAELDADSSIGLTWDELKTRLAARRA